MNANPHVYDLKYICTGQHEEEAWTPEIKILITDKVSEDMKGPCWEALRSLLGGSKVPGRL